MSWIEDRAEQEARLVSNDARQGTALKAVAVLMAHAILKELEAIVDRSHYINNERFHGACEAIEQLKELFKD